MIDTVHISTIWRHDSLISERSKLEKEKERERVKAERIRQQKEEEEREKEAEMKRKEYLAEVERTEAKRREAELLKELEKERAILELERTIAERKERRMKGEGNKKEGKEGKKATAIQSPTSSSSSLQKERADSFQNQLKDCCLDCRRDVDGVSSVFVVGN